MITLEKYKNGKTKWPKRLTLQVLMDDWRKARKALPLRKVNSGTIGGKMVGERCALAQTFIRLVNEDRRFVVGGYSTNIQEKDSSGRWQTVATYRNPTGARTIIDAFDTGEWQDDNGRKHKGVPPIVKEGVELTFEKQF